MPDIDILVDVGGERVAAFLGKLADFGPCVSTELNPMPLSLAQYAGGTAGAMKELVTLQVFG